MEPMDDDGVMELFQQNEKKKKEYNNNNNNEKKEMKVNSEIVHLTEELIEDEILVRLPVKSLMRFKCVVRNWNALFTNATFITRHMQMQRHAQRFMVFGHNNKGSTINLNLTPTSSFSTSEENFALEENENNFCYKYGLHKGIFCLYRVVHPRKLILWNPLTKKLKHVDPPPRHNHEEFNIVYTGGIGSDPNNIYDLKIVHLICGLSAHSPPLAEVYTLNTNSWTFLDTVVPVAMARLLRSFNHGVYANGVCHWVYSIMNDRNRCILCFDFRTNQFHRIDFPPITITKLPIYNFLLEINDSIAYVEYHDSVSPPWTDIWILEQQQNNNNNNSCCWTKKFKFGGSVPIYAFVKDGSRFLGPSNKFFTKQESQSLLLYNSDGQQIIEQSSAFFSSKKDLLPLVLYNSDGQPVHQFEQEVNQRRYLFCIFKYEESMAPFHFF